jgi:hypothetical protein
MYKNIVLYKTFGNEITDYTNEIVLHLPGYYNGYTNFKIDLLKVDININKTLIGIKQDKNIIKTADAIDVSDKTIDVYDLYSYKKPKMYSQEMCYIISNQENNCLFLNQNINLNLIGFTQIKDNSIIFESSWIKSTNKDIINFSLYDQEFEKISIKNFYIIIKLSYE